MKVTKQKTFVPITIELTSEIEYKIMRAIAQTMLNIPLALDKSDNLERFKLSQVDVTEFLSVLFGHFIDLE